MYLSAFDDNHLGWVWNDSHAKLGHDEGATRCAGIRQ